ncbi:MAG: ComF family protein [Patescibacteria group bacterium]|jgi:ComF family protein
MRIAEKIITPIVDTVFPRLCVGCGEADQTICPKCFDQITLMLKQRCVRCEKLSSLGRTCPKCREHSELDNLLAFAYYEGPIKEAMHQYKYEGRVDALNSFKQIINQNQTVIKDLNSLIKPDSIIVPVPLYRQRLWWRGFNQSDLIARIFADQFGLPILSNRLFRTVYTIPQMKLQRRGRLHNLEGVFECLEMQNQTVFLIDDIATTGSTLSACAAALKHAGAKKVVGVTVARV